MVSSQNITIANLYSHNLGLQAREALGTLAASESQKNRRQEKKKQNDIEVACPDPTKNPAMGSEIC